MVPPRNPGEQGAPDEAMVPPWNPGERGAPDEAMVPPRNPGEQGAPDKAMVPPRKPVSEALPRRLENRQKSRGPGKGRGGEAEPPLGTGRLKGGEATSKWREAWEWKSDADPREWGIPG